jgi:protein disulfide-isomerase
MQSLSTHPKAHPNAHSLAHPPRTAFLRPLLSLLCAAPLVLTLGTTTAQAASPTLPYDESADARVELNRALDQAHASGKKVLVVFGANWCPDCRALAGKMATGPLAAEVAAHYVVTKVDVGRFNKNLDLDKQMGDPIAKGIPAVAVLGPDGDVLQSTRAGELASAREMGDAEVMKVFEGLAAQP